MKVPSDELERVKFWKRTWANLWNILGVISVLIGFMWGAWWLFFGAPLSSSLSFGRIDHAIAKDQSSRQGTANSVIMSTQQPCAARRRADRLSNVKDCSLFRISLGATVEEVKHMITNSGYFMGKIDLITRCDPQKMKCDYSHYIHEQRDGFSVTVDFNARSNEDKTLAAQQIGLWFSPGGSPYYDPQSLRTTFIKLIGPPDETTDTTDYWGEAHAGTHARAYLNKEDRRYFIAIAK